MSKPYWFVKSVLSLRQNRLEDSSVQLLSCVHLFATAWTAAHQASLFITNSLSLLKLMSIESVMSSNHLILCHPLLFSLLYGPTLTSTHD